MAAEIPDGAVLIARAIFNSSLWTMRDKDRILAITLIGIANWRDRKWFDGDKEITIKRGELVRSLDDLAESARLSVRNVRTSLARLEKVGFLTRKPTRRYTHVTLCKYDHYQNLSKYSDTISDTQPTGDRHDPDTTLTRPRHATDNKQESYQGDASQKGEESTAPSKPTPAAPPPELAGLALYEGDQRLCSRWAKLLPSWRKAFPGVDIVAETRKAHAWELANPERIKKNRPKFLQSWFSRQQDKPHAPVAPSRNDENGRTKCIACGGSRTEAGGMKDGKIVYIACKRCSRQEASA